MTRVVLATAALALAGCVDRGQVLGPGTPVVLQVSPVRLALGREHACAVVGGALACWGLDDDGQLGTPPASPVWARRPPPSRARRPGSCRPPASATAVVWMPAGGSGAGARTTWGSWGRAIRRPAPHHARWRFRRSRWTSAPCSITPARCSRTRRSGAGVRTRKDSSGRGTSIRARTNCCRCRSGRIATGPSWPPARGTAADSRAGRSLLLGAQHGR